VRFLNPARPTDDEGHWVLDLRPHSPEPTLARLVITVDSREFLVRAARVYDQFDNTVTMRFTETVANTGLPDRLFAFAPPPGAALVPFDTR
jgi:outer membrane lipoprotein-sorting protein